MSVTVNRWCETTRRYLPSIVIRDDDGSREWHDLFAWEREAARPDLEPGELAEAGRRGGHQAQEGGDDAEA